MTVIDPQHFSVAAHFSDVASANIGGIPASPRVVFCGEFNRRKAVPIENEPKNITMARPSRFSIPSRSVLKGLTNLNNNTIQSTSMSQPMPTEGDEQAISPETQVLPDLAAKLAAVSITSLSQRSSSFTQKESSIENLRFVRDESIIGLHKLTQIPQGPSEPSTPLKLQMRTSKKDGKSRSSGVRGKQQQDRAGGPDFDQEVPRQGIPLSPEVIFSAGMTAIPVAVYEAIAAQQAAENKSGVMKSLVRWWRGKTHQTSS